MSRGDQYVVFLDCFSGLRNDKGLACLIFNLLRIIMSVSSNVDVVT